jgi:outer membrane lipopolysaccharide assembly protein LptE/RlpB
MTIFFMATVPALLASCGYQFAGAGQLPADVKLIHVAVLENPSAETGIETILSNALIQVFTRRGHHVAPRHAGADATLSGRIADLRIDSINRKSARTTESGRVILSLDLSLVNSKGQHRWSAKSIAASQTYDIIPDSKLVTEENRRIAIKSLSTRLAETVYDRLTTEF